jgi:hypothetical protein
MSSDEKPGSADEDTMEEIAMFDEHCLPKDHHHSLLPQRLLQKTVLALHRPKGHLQVRHYPERRHILEIFHLRNQDSTGLGEVRGGHFQSSEIKLCIGEKLKHEMRSDPRCRNSSLRTWLKRCTCVNCRMVEDHSVLMMKKLAGGCPRLRLVWGRLLLRALFHQYHR